MDYKRLVDLSTMAVLKANKQRAAIRKQAENLSLLDLDLRKLPDPDWGNKAAVSDWTSYKLWKDAAASDDKRLRRTIQNVFAEQGKRVQEKLERLWPIQKADEGKVDDLLRFAFDVGQADADVRGVIIPETKKLLVKYGNDLMASKNIPIPLIPSNPAVGKFMERWAGSEVRHITDGTRDLLHRQLIAAADAGEPIKAVLGRIGNVFQGDISVARAQKIARTELVTVSQNGRLIAAKESGVLKKKRWISELLPTTRQEKQGANHAAVHGTSIGIDELFQVRSRSGIDQMACPGDPNASGENRINCVCVCSYFTTGAFSDLFGNPTE